MLPIQPTIKKLYSTTKSLFNRIIIPFHRCYTVEIFSLTKYNLLQLNLFSYRSWYTVISKHLNSFLQIKEYFVWWCIDLSVIENTVIADKFERLQPKILNISGFICFELVTWNWFGGKNPRRIFNVILLVSTKLPFHHFIIAARLKSYSNHLKTNLWTNPVELELLELELWRN